MNKQLAESIAKSFEDPRLVDNSTAADILGLSPKTLIIWRCTRKYDIPYVKVGRRVLYDMHDLAVWVEQRKIRHMEPAVAIKQPPRFARSRPRRAMPQPANRKKVAPR